MNAVAYVNEAGFIRLRRAVPDACGGCGMAAPGARPNWGAKYLCPGCKGDALVLIDYQVRIDEENAAITALIDAHEAHLVTPGDRVEAA